MNQMKEVAPAPAVEECQCSTCGHPVAYRLFFVGQNLFSQCVFCGARYDIEATVLARAEAIDEASRLPPVAPPPPPPAPPAKKSLWGKKPAVKQPA